MARICDLPHAQRFKHNILCMKTPILQALKASDSSILTPPLLEGTFAVIAIVEPEVIIENFVERTHPNWGLLVEPIPDESLPGLEKMLDIFTEIGAERSKEISRLARHPKVPKDLKVKIWTLVRSLIKISLRYVHEKRKPVDGALFVYKNASYFTNIDLKSLSESYALDLYSTPSTVSTPLTPASPLTPQTSS